MGWLLVGTQTCVIECRPVGVEWRAGWIQNNNRLRNCVGNPAKFAFIVPQFLFGLLKRFDVGACSIPTDDLPASSRNGSMRMRNQRKTPSWRRRRASISPGSPEVNSSRHFSINGGKSSGWNAACQPQPCDSSGERPVYSCHFLLRNSFGPSGRLHQASVGIVSIACRSLASDVWSSPSAFLSASCDRCRSIAMRVMCPAASISARSSCVGRGAARRNRLQIVPRNLITFRQYRLGPRRPYSILESNVAEGPHSQAGSLATFGTTTRVASGTRRCHTILFREQRAARSYRARPSPATPFGPAVGPEVFPSSSIKRIIVTDGASLKVNGKAQM